MKTELLNVIKYQIIPDNYDLINIYFDDIEPRKGRVIIECYGKVWSIFWDGMGSKKVKDFFMFCENEYLIEHFLPQPKHKKILKAILKIVKEELKEAENESI